MDSAFTAFLMRLPLSHPARKAIFESWRRSEAAGVSREGELAVPRVPEAQLKERLKKAASFVQAARPHLEALVASLPGTTNVAYITDADGIVLSSAGNPEHIERFGLAPGHDWSEATMGTNGAGTCLRRGRPVIVQGPEHFKASLEDCTCTAVVVRDSEGQIIGALDVSSSVADATFGRLRKVAEVTRQIEKDLRAAQGRS